MRSKLMIVIVLVLAGITVSAQNASPPAAPGGAGNAPAAAGARGGGGGGRQLSPLIEGPDLGYKAVPNGLPLPIGMQFGALAGVVQNSQNHIFVYGGTRPALNEVGAAPLPLVEFDENGKFIRAFGKELEYKSPHGFRIDSNDNFYLADLGDHTVRKLNSKGELVMTLGTPNKAGVWDEATGTHTFNQPTDLWVAPNGDIFVAQGHGGNGDPRVLRFDKNGKYITSWSGKVEGPAAFTGVHGIVMDPQNKVWVGDRSAKKILVFDVNGKYERSIQMPVYVCSFYVARDGQLYMLSGWDGQVLKLDWNGKILAATGKPGRGLNMYGEAMSMILTPKNEIFVADKVNDYVQKLIPR